MAAQLLSTSAPVAISSLVKGSGLGATTVAVGSSPSAGGGWIERASGLFSSVSSVGGPAGAQQRPGRQPTVSVMAALGCPPVGRKSRRRMRSRRGTLIGGEGGDDDALSWGSDDDAFGSDTHAPLAGGWDGSTNGGSFSGGSGGRGSGGWAGGSGWWLANYGGEPGRRRWYEGMLLYQLVCAATTLQAAHYMLMSMPLGRQQPQAALQAAASGCAEGAGGIARC